MGAIYGTSEWMLQFKTNDAMRLVHQVEWFVTIKEKGLENDFHLIYTDEEVQTLKRIVGGRDQRPVNTDMFADNTTEMELVNAVAYMHGIPMSITKI